jgi:hypothetical protein
MTMSYITAMKHFFGLLPNENLAGFKAELDAVKPFRSEFIAGLEMNGYTITDKDPQ